MKPIECTQSPRPAVKTEEKGQEEEKARENIDIQSLLNSGVDGKAGTPISLSQVGEVQHFYRMTRKLCHIQHSTDVVMTDLQGYAKNEALNTIKKILPEWVDIAMKGKYP